MRRGLGIAHQFFAHRPFSQNQCPPRIKFGAGFLWGMLKR
jgi:hypothetical protein